MLGILAREKPRFRRMPEIPVRLLFLPLPFILPLFLLLVLLPPLLLPAPALALDLVLSPARLEYTLDKGETLENTLRITHNEDKPMRVRIYPKDLLVGPDGSFEYPRAGATTYSAALWFELEKLETTVPANGHLEVGYTLEVPDNAEPGGHFAMLFVEGIEEDEGGNISFTGRLGSQVLLTVPGDIKQSLEIEEFSVPRIVFSGGQTFAVKVLNTGNVHVIPAGYLQAWGGIPGVDIKNDLRGATLLPGATHTYTVEPVQLPWLGHLRAKADLRYGPDAATLDQSVTAETDFYVISWKVILILGMLLLGFGIALLREWRRRKKEGAPLRGSIQKRRMIR